MVTPASMPKAPQIRPISLAKVIFRAWKALSAYLTVSATSSVDTKRGASTLS
jgi:hypothetical protein